jgi:pimeloyl-ACP methyl ester carboxylesterase
MEPLHGSKNAPLQQVFCFVQLMVQEFSPETLKKIRLAGKWLNALARVSPALAGKVAFKVFCTPRRQPVRAQDESFLATAQQAHMMVRQQKICYYSWPSSAPSAHVILLLHGWESNSGRWRNYVKALHKSGFTVYAIDAPASGKSGGKQLNALLFSEAVATFTREVAAPYMVVGHSLGGAAAVFSSAMLDAPAPQKMVLLGVFAESTRVIHDFAALLALTDTVVEAIFKTVERRTGLPMQGYSVVQKVATLRQVQGLVIHDTDDNVAPLAEGALIADSWGADFIQTSGFGHRLQDKSVVQAVVAFAQKEG